MPNSLKLRLPELVIEGKRLGRTINHDLRSMSYLVTESSTPVVKEWPETIPILDQGQLGSCTGNAATGMLGTGPFSATIPATTKLDENFAVSLYELATQLDSFAGTYPPTDTGSDGVSVSKAAQQRGLLSGYVHAVSLAGCMAMIATGPFIIGINWYSGMDNPDANGNVSVTGQVRGGHEVCVVGRDADGRWRIRNSWTNAWGLNGHFYLTDNQLIGLLAEQGDATQGVPITAPAPVPTPTPVITVGFTTDQYNALNAWAPTLYNWDPMIRAAAAWRAATHH